MKESKNIIVTGGAGFIGSHLVERLIEEGHQIRVLDNLLTGRIENLVSVREHPRLKFCQADISQESTLDSLFSDVDWVFHLAALADIVPSIQRPMDYFKSNVDGTIKILEASRKNNIKRFIYTASSSCYGIPDHYPTSESSEIRAQYPYALTKNLGEQLTLHWNKVYKLPAISLRLFNVYGPRSRTSGTYGAVFGVFLAQKLAGKPFTIVGDGKQTRDFTFVTDVVEAFVKAAESNIQGEILNVGSGKTYSINRLTELLQGERTFIPKRPGEPDCTFADISKINRLLNWSPKVTFEQGVQKMLDSIEYWKTAPVWEPDSIKNATKDWFHYLSS